MLFCKDAKEEFLSPESVDLFFTHPPYFSTRFHIYGGDQQNQLNNTDNDAIRYMDNMIAAINSMEKALKPTGSLLLILQNDRTGLEILSRIIKETKLVAEKTFIWNYKNSHFVKDIKGEEFCIILHLHRGSPYINMSNVDDFIISMPWHPTSIDLEKYNKEEFFHDSFPEELAVKIIDIFSKPGDVVADLFGGTGTTCVVAKKLNRSYIYNDLSSEQYEVAKERLND